MTTTLPLFLQSDLVVLETSRFRFGERSGSILERSMSFLPLFNKSTALPPSPSYETLPLTSSQPPELDLESTLKRDPPKKARFADSPTRRSSTSSTDDDSFVFELTEPRKRSCLSSRWVIAASFVILQLVLIGVYLAVGHVSVARQRMVLGGICDGDGKAICDHYG